MYYSIIAIVETLKKEKNSLTKEEVRDISI